MRTIGSPGLGDPAGNVGLARLILLRGEAEVGSQGARAAEAGRVVDRRGEG